jgi:light-regulated signal transduction histidine kinase (bacteriophytochrome)
MVVSNKESLDQLSHQMCNHLAHIMLASNLLQLDLDEILSAEQRHQFKGIDEGAKQIRTLLARLKRETEAEFGSLRPEQSAKA